jgi:hypothetical protein
MIVGTEDDRARGWLDYKRLGGPSTDPQNVTRDVADPCPLALACADGVLFIRLSACPMNDNVICP